MSQLTTQCTESCSIILDNLVLGEKHGIKITQKIILRFIEWSCFQKLINTFGGKMKTGHWDLQRVA